MAPSYQLTRFLILRLLGLVYLVAFVVFLNQGLALIGHQGLTPADRYLVELADAGAGFWRAPTVFWLGCSDLALQSVAWVGAAVSLAVFLGLTNAGAMFVLWALYLSLAHVGQTWWGFGW